MIINDFHFIHWLETELGFLGDTKFILQLDSRVVRLCGHVVSVGGVGGRAEGAPGQFTKPRAGADVRAATRIWARDSDLGLAKAFHACLPCLRERNWEERRSHNISKQWFHSVRRME